MYTFDESIIIIAPYQVDKQKMLKVFLPNGKHSKAFRFLSKLGTWIVEQKCFKIPDQSSSRIRLASLGAEQIWVDEITVVNNDKKNYTSSSNIGLAAEGIPISDID